MIGLKKGHIQVALLGALSFVPLDMLSGVLAVAQDKVASSSWHWKIGVNERVRAEYRQDFDLNESRKDNGNQYYHRLLLNVAATVTDENLKEKTVFFIEGLDARTGGYKLKSPAGQNDNFDLHQAYIQLYGIFGSDFNFKAGRMELIYGAGRLVAAPTWANRIRSFDGAVLTFKDETKSIDFLYGQRVIYDDNDFNESSANEFITGLYGGYRQNKEVTLYEVYFLQQVIRSGASNIDRYTMGARLNGSLPHQIVWELEFPFQFGKNNTNRIRAYAFNISLDKNWDTAWKPRLYMEYNQASGDEDSTDSVINTFIPLYQSVHKPYGLMDFFRWQNMREIAVRLDVFPIDKLTLTPQVNFFWLENKNDAWYTSSGSIKRYKTSGPRDSYVGNEISFRAQYQINKNIKWESGYAHFFSGSYVEDSGTSDDANWVYTQLMFDF